MAVARKDHVAQEIRILCNEVDCNLNTDLSVYTFYHHTLDRLPANYRAFLKDYKCVCGAHFPDIIEAGFHSADMKLRKDRRSHEIQRSPSFDIKERIRDIEEMAMKFRHNLKSRGNIVVKELDEHDRTPALTPNGARMQTRSAQRPPSAKKDGTPGQEVQQDQRTRHQSMGPEVNSKKSQGMRQSRGVLPKKDDVPFKLKPYWAQKSENQKRRKEANAVETPMSSANTPASSDQPDSEAGRQRQSRSLSRSPCAMPNEDSESEDESEQRVIIEETRRTTRSMSRAGVRSGVPNPAGSGHQKQSQQRESEQSSSSRGAPDESRRMARRNTQVENQSNRQRDADEAPIESPTNQIHFFTGPLRSQHQSPGGHAIYEYDRSSWEDHIGQPWSAVPQDQDEPPLDRNGTGYQWVNYVQGYQSRSPECNDRNGHGRPQDSKNSHGSASAELDPYACRKRGRSETRKVTASTVRGETAEGSGDSAPSTSRVDEELPIGGRQPSEPPRKRGRPRKTPAPEDDEPQPSRVYNPADFPLRDHDGVYTRTRSRSRARSMTREPTPPNYDDSRLLDWERDLEEIDRLYGRTRSSTRR